jgi:hypothetical protein
MTTTIERRVARLEATDRGDRCPECSWEGDPLKVEYVVEWQDPGGPTEPDEFCETCGRQLTCTIHMDWGGSA